MRVSPGGMAAAVKSAREKIGHTHRIAVDVASKSESAEAIRKRRGRPGRRRFCVLLI